MLFLLALLYAIDDCSDPLLTVKVIGNQWYWRYEYDNGVHSIDKYPGHVGIGFKDPRLVPFIQEGVGFDVYMIHEDELKLHSKPLRLFEVDGVCHLPILTHTRLLVTSLMFCILCRSVSWC